MDKVYLRAKIIFLAGTSCNCGTIFKDPFSAVSTPTTPLLVVVPDQNRFGHQNQKLFDL